MALVDAGFTLTTDGTISGLNYSEHLDSNKVAVREDENYAERVFLVDWQNVDRFINYLVGFPTRSLKSNGGSYTLYRSTQGATLPDIHPRYGQNYQNNPPTYGMYCVEAESEGQGVPGLGQSMQDPTYGNAPKFAIAKVRAKYRSLDYDVIPDNQVSSEMYRFCIRRNEGNFQYATHYGHMYFFSGSQQCLPIPPGQIVATVNKTITWKKIPSLDYDPTAPWKVFNCPTWSTVLNLIGKTNSVSFDGDPAGTVLFCGIDPHRSRPSFIGGNVYWDIVYQLAVKNSGSPVIGDTVDAAAGWNYILNGYLPTPGWDLVTADKTITGTRIYQQGDLNALFQIPG